MKRPVIFYFISMSTLFCWGKEAVRKIERTLEVFYNYREEAMVLWVQDPNLFCLQKRMPEVFLAYEEMVKSFREKGGKTPRAPLDHRLDPVFRMEMDECKAYYGDSGFFAEVFSEAGKPVMIQELSL